MTPAAYQDRPSEKGLLSTLVLRGTKAPGTHGTFSPCLPRRAGRGGGGVQCGPGPAPPPAAPQELGLWAEEGMKDQPGGGLGGGCPVQGWAKLEGHVTGTGGTRRVRLAGGRDSAFYALTSLASAWTSWPGSPDCPGCQPTLPVQTPQARRAGARRPWAPIPGVSSPTITPPSVTWPGHWATHGALRPLLASSSGPLLSFHLGDPSAVSQLRVST